MKHAVVIENLTFAYERRAVLSEVNLEIETGKLAGFIGPNGGGKTTLFRLILGLLKPDSGSLKVFGEAPNQVRDRIAYVPQGLVFDRLFPITTLELVLAGRLRNIPWYGSYSAADKAAAVKALALVGLEDRLNTPFRELSGGQAQRAVIARGLVSQPKLLLLDEPTANVDARTEAEIYELLNRLRGETTILLVTHDFEVATRLVDEVICVQRRVDRLAKAQVCEHFGIGIYHTPLTTTEKEQSE